MALLELETVIRSRKDNPSAGSYTASLLADPERTQRKIMEEAFELCLELGRSQVSHERVAQETADLLYHVMVGLAGVDVDFAEVLAVLEERRK